LNIFSAILSKTHPQPKQPNMKSKLTLLFLALTTSFALAHGGVEIGPNGGRILEFSKMKPCTAKSP
jgi:hypothetical protein